RAGRVAILYGEGEGGRGQGAGGETRREDGRTGEGAKGRPGEGAACEDPERPDDAAFECGAGRQPLAAHAVEIRPDRLDAVGGIPSVVAEAVIPEPVLTPRAQSDRHAPSFPPRRRAGV